jgi:trk system potassium uptake protein TrkH
MSFVTTTGFVSENWDQAQNWSGLQTPGLVLLGLALIGGGVATTAGGVKLLRVYALYVHGQRELGRLLHPSLVAATGKPGRAVPKRGVYIAWVFFMLFALSVAVVWVSLAISGIEFEAAMILTVSALSTTGPLLPIATGGEVLWGDLGSTAKSVLMVAMIMGRLETLAIIALLNREFWSR